MFRQVLVPIDCSPGAERLVQGAATAAGRLDAGLILWGVLRPGDDRRAMENRLHELLATQADGHGAYMAVASDDPVDALTDRAERPGTLLCVVSHGQGRIGEQAMGCLTAELLSESRTPMLVFGPRVDVRHAAAISWRHVVACVDASDRAERALTLGAGFARAAGLDLVVMQAVTAGDDLFDGERSRLYVDSLATSVRPAATPVVVDGGHNPGLALSEQANRMGAALLVVASRGRGGPMTTSDPFEPVGSVTDTLIRNSERPVLVLPAHASPVPAMAGAGLAWH